MKIIHIVGARPNFMKMAPLFKAFTKYKAVRQLVVHTGQHYNDTMSDVFFRELKLKKPDINLQVGSDTHAKQTANIMLKLEEVMLKEKPDMVLVYGDVNSTLAASIVCAKMNIKIAHIEAGLRSYDMSMPEEANRLVTDKLSSLLFTPSTDADNNLIHEGTDKKKIHFVGNVMIDTLISFMDKIKREVKAPFEKFAVVTMHRPSNVDNPQQLQNIVASLNRISQKIPLVFPVHPRTEIQLKKIGGVGLDKKRIAIYKPLGYLEFVSLVYQSKFVITDSGGIQEETTYLGIPCLTLRPNTERPVTVNIGTNTLISDLKTLEKTANAVIKGKYKKGKIPTKWDGKASERIAKIIVKELSKSK